MMKTPKDDNINETNDININNNNIIMIPKIKTITSTLLNNNTNINKRR